MSLQLRRGTDSDRLQITPAAGEPIYTTDTQKLYIGDGTTSGGVIVGGEIGTPTDGDLTDGAINTSHPQYLVSTASVADGIDYLNEALLNVANNTFISALSFTGSPTSGGLGTSVTLSLNATGNANRYDIYWGDGDVDSNVSSVSPSHTYNSNDNSPFDVRVVARNNSGSGVGSQVEASRTDYITIATADPVAAFRLYRYDSPSASILSGNSLYVVEGQSLYLENITSNADAADVEYTLDWGDGSSDDTIDSAEAIGGTLGDKIQHTWGQGTSSGTSTDTITLTLTSHSTADANSIPSVATSSIKVYDDGIGAPNSLSSKTISNNFTSIGTSPYLASGFTASFTPTTGAGQSINRVTSSGTIESTVLSTYAYDANSGTLNAVVDGSTDGSIALTSADNSGTNSSLVITDEEDYNLLNASGSSVSFGNSIYYPGLYKGFKAKVSKANLSTGVHSYKLSHSTGGDTNTIEFVKDNLTNTPTISSAGVLTENVAGTYRYVSGIPYYNTGSPSLTLSGVQISNLVGQTYRNTSDIVQVVSGTNYEGTSSSAISTRSYTYADIDGSSTMLAGGIPLANTGVGSAYAIGTLTIPLTSASVRTVEQINILSKNVNGTGSSSAITGKIQIHTAAQSGINETAIDVSNSLGSTYTDDGVRIFDFSSETTNNPSFNNATNFYTNNIYTESSDPGVSGTKEATVRLGTLKHDISDYSSGFLPAGPDRSGDTGTQYFTFAFRRTSLANFNINITSSGISGVWIAAPGTDIDNTSTLNGWLDCSIQYNGAGIPGADTGNGGNGSNGCASTGGDIISTGTSLNGSYTMTLGTENLSNATGNVALVRIALASGESVTSLSIL